MSSSFFEKLREDIKAGRGSQAQKELGFAVKDGRIDRNAATKFFGEIKPLLAANSKETPLTDAELAQVKADIAARRQVLIDKIPKAIRQGAVTEEEVRQYSTDIRRAQGREDPDPYGGKTPQSIFDNPEYIRRKKEAELNRIKPKRGVQSANKTIEALNRSKITSEPSEAIKAKRKPQGAPLRDPSTANKSFSNLANRSIDFEGKLRPDSRFSQEDLDRFNKRQADARFNFSLLYGKDALQPITTYSRVEDLPRYTEEELRQRVKERLKANPKSKFNRDKAKLEAGIPLDPFEAARARFGKPSASSSQSRSSAPSSQSRSSASRLQNAFAQIDNLDGLTKEQKNDLKFSRAQADTNQSRSSAPSSKSGSNLNRERFTNFLERLQEAKARLSSKSGKSKTPAPRVTATEPTPADAPAPRVTGPAFKSVNTPVTNPDAPTNNVTKPTGAAAGSQRQNKKQSKLQNAYEQIDNLDLTKEQKNDLKFSRAQAEYNNTFDRGDFKFLLGKLEGSKIRQNRDAQSQERQNIFSRGLSSMFANF